MKTDKTNGMNSQGQRPQKVVARLRTLLAAGIALVFLTNCAPTSMVKETFDVNEKGLALGEEERIFSVVEEDSGGTLQSSATGIAESADATPVYALVDKRRCVFYLKGEKGAQWMTERYTSWANSDCAAERAQVIANNPKATITDMMTNYVADQVPFEVHKTKCTFVLQGANGATWISERYRAANGLCLGEYSTVTANNPNARILSITANYVHDPVASSSKNKCTFRLVGARGNRWFSERYVPANQNCDVEVAMVRANNPDARIEMVSQNFVFDPF